MTKLQETRKALKKLKQGPLRIGLISLVARAERAIEIQDTKRARDCMAALASTAINFPTSMSKSVAIGTIIGVLIDANTFSINLRKIGVGWERGRRCSLSGDRRCVAAQGNTCYEDSTGCISTSGNPPSILINARIKPLSA